HDRALLEAERLVGDDQLRVEQHLLAEAVAGRAGALRGVEGEQARLDFLDGEARDGTGELFAEHDAVGGEAGALEAPSARFAATSPVNGGGPGRPALDSSPVYGGRLHRAALDSS